MSWTLHAYNVGTTAPGIACMHTGAFPASAEEASQLAMLGRHLNQYH